jgi:hypothetical protein
MAPAQHSGKSRGREHAAQDQAEHTQEDVDREAVSPTDEHRSVGEAVIDAYKMNAEHATGDVVDRTKLTGEVPGRFGAPNPEAAVSAPQTEE